jgi:hypothetical protein
MGLVQVQGTILAGPAGSGAGQFPASQFQDNLGLGVAVQGKPYQASTSSVGRSLSSPLAFEVFPDVGAAGSVTHADTLYFKCDGPVVLLLTQDDGTGRTPGPVGGGIVGAVSGAGGLVKLTTATPHGLQAGDSVTVGGVGGTVEANGQATVASTDLGPTTFALSRIVFENAYTSSSGVVSYNALQSAEPVSGLVLKEFPSQNALLGLAAKGTARVTFFASGPS